METPINILVAKITGTVVYRGHGSGNIEPRYGVFKEEPYEMILDGEEFNPSTLSFLPNGYLCIYTCIGDEQPSSTMHIIRDWKIEHVPQALPVMEEEEFGKLFYRFHRRNDTLAMPKELKKLFESNG